MIFLIWRRCSWFLSRGRIRRVRLYVLTVEDVFDTVSVRFVC